MLEQKIEALTAAVEALTKALLAQPTTPNKAKAPKAEAPKVEAEAPKVEAEAEAPKAEAPKAEAPKAEAPKAEAPKAEAPKAKAKFTLQDIREVAQKCLDADKLQGVVKINLNYGLRKIGQATEDQLEPLHADLTALLNG